MKKFMAALKKLPVNNPWRRWCAHTGIPQLPDRELTDAEVFELLKQIYEKQRSQWKIEQKQKKERSTVAYYVKKRLED
tara:strand:- start:335 stop:568 length:234 start_codon:yes stop_codon:yes gene_type:complete